VEKIEGDRTSARFLQELVEFGFEVAKVKPKIVRDNGHGSYYSHIPIASEWIDTLWRWNSRTNLRSASEGLALFAEGFDSIDLAVKGLEFAERLVKTAEAVDDQILDAVVLRSDVLSELLNLGGLYKSLHPVTRQETPTSFLEVLLNGGSTGEIITASNFLETSISQRSPEKSFKFGQEILKCTQTATFLDASLRRDAQYLGLAASAGSNYIYYIERVDAEVPTLISASLFPDRPAEQIRYVTIPFTTKQGRAFEARADVETFLAKGKIANNNEADMGFCMELFQAIQDTHQELSNRYIDMMNDAISGYNYFETDKDKWRNYQRRYNNVRTALKQLTDFFDEHCKNHHYYGFEELAAFERSQDAVGQKPPGKPAATNASDFTLPDWAITAGVTVVGGVVVIGVGASLPLWGLGILGVMTAAFGIQMVVK
jgi:hypothetical protein